MKRTVDSRGRLVRESSCKYDRGTEIRNTRQISVLSQEELSRIAANMEVDRIEPQWVGANLILSGIPDLTLLPPSTRLIFESGVALVVDMENGPCRFPGEVIDQFHPGFGSRFPKSARHLRGFTAWVEREGELSTGERCVVHLPIQPAYPHTPA